MKKEIPSERYSNSRKYAEEEIENSDYTTLQDRYEKGFMKESGLELAKYKARRRLGQAVWNEDWEEVRKLTDYLEKFHPMTTKRKELARHLGFFMLGRNPRHGTTEGVDVLVDLDEFGNVERFRRDFVTNIECDEDEPKDLTTLVRLFDLPVHYKHLPLLHPRGKKFKEIRIKKEDLNTALQQEKFHLKRVQDGSIHFGEAIYF